MTTAAATSTVHRVAGVMIDVDLAAKASDTVRRVAKALQGFYDVAPDELARALGISKATVYRKLNGDSEFSAGEVAVLAQLFGSDVTAFYTGHAVFDTNRATELATGRYSATSSLGYRGLSLVPAIPTDYQPVAASYGSSATARSNADNRQVAVSAGQVNDADAA